jgi:RNA polymerase sigma-70 factor (ECF subfamily)
MEGDTLEKLVRGSVAGDTASFRFLVERLEQKLFGYIHSRSRSRDDALDTLQNTLILMWQSLRRFEYRSDEAFYRFVFTIAKREMVRSHRRKEEVSLDDISELADMASTADTYDRIAVTQSLQRLDERSRDILVLRHWSGFSLKEIAGLLSMREEAVRVRHHRALEKLRALLPMYA